MTTLFDYIKFKYLFGGRLKIPTCTYQIHNSVINIKEMQGGGKQEGSFLPPPPCIILVGGVGRKRLSSPRVKRIFFSMYYMWKRSIFIRHNFYFWENLQKISIV